MSFWVGVTISAAVLLLVLFADEKLGLVKLLNEIVGGLRGKRYAREAARRRQEAHEKRQEELAAAKAKQDYVNALGGEHNFALIRTAQSAVTRIGESEAAREGWLGDIDFSTDLQAITDSFRKAQALRATAGELSMLDTPTAEDRRLMDDAKKTASDLEFAAAEQVELIGKCALEAQRIDASLSEERREAKAAEQRAELHGKLAALLYGSEVSPVGRQTVSAAGSVMARVEAYREIRDQIHQSREG